MELRITRTKTSRRNLLGVLETHYVLRMQAIVPVGEAALLRTHDEEGRFTLSADVVALIAEKKILGPSHPSLDRLKRGVEYSCKAAAKLRTIPGDILSDYRDRLGRVRAAENWVGEEHMSTDELAVTRTLRDAG